MSDSLGLRFERNQYFTGKLLTAQDFKSEQNYFNSKRMLVNRLLHGCGIVCGLQVLPVTKKVLAVDAGVAIDNFGREIVVDSVISQSLSEISGFPEGEFSGSLYLCIRFKENLKDPAYTVEDFENNSVYNRVQESYELFLSKHSPNPAEVGLQGLAEDIQLLYEGANVKLWQRTPRFVNPGEVFEVKVLVEKELKTPKLSIDYKIDTQYVKPLEEGGDLLSFVEPEGLDGTRFEFSYLLRADDISNIEGRLSLNDSSLTLKVGDRKIDAGSTCVNTIKIVTEDIQEAILGNYFGRSLEKSLNTSGENSIYLAKISILKVETSLGNTYTIEKIEDLTASQKIYTATMLQQIEKSMKLHYKQEALPEVSAVAAPALPSPPKEAPVLKEESEKQDTPALPVEALSGAISTGKAEIEMENESKSVKKYISAEIEHGLGLGPVFIVAGLEESENGVLADLMHRSEQVYFGEYKVFQDSPYGSTMPPYKIGIVTYPKKGTFRIGVQFDSPVKIQKLRVRWCAYRSESDAKGYNKISIHLEPEFVELKTSAIHQFVPQVSGSENSALEWRINEPNGGFISEDGLYTAPNRKGVYSVTVTSKENPLCNTTVYVIVKE